MKIYVSSLDILHTLLSISIYLSIYPSIYPSIQFTVAKGLESILATTGGEAGYTQVASLTQA